MNSFKNNHNTIVVLQELTIIPQYCLFSRHSRFCAVLSRSVVSDSLQARAL